MINIFNFDLCCRRIPISSMIMKFPLLAMKKMKGMIGIQLANNSSEFKKKKKVVGIVIKCKMTMNPKRGKEQFGDYLDQQEGGVYLPKSLVYIVQMLSSSCTIMPTLVTRLVHRDTLLTLSYLILTSFFYNFGCFVSFFCLKCHKLKGK